MIIQSPLVLLFDFDGVLFDSNQILGKAFYLLFKNYDETETAAVIQHHGQHGGINRR